MKQQSRESCWYADRFSQIGAGASYRPEDVDVLYAHEARPCPVCKALALEKAGLFLNGRLQIRLEKMAGRSRDLAHQHLKRRLRAYRRSQWINRIKRVWNRVFVSLNI